ncbi:hypothetical protein [Ruegeria sp. HKCCA5491]|uniref:hypothetical protein n=1 Tax=Ruegeria sp. HKCCA5491 TaxID=2682986 RepID=UPI00148886B4|nr:hypothetical protein [Ruegeria sp. HKCCA5491]
MPKPQSRLHTVNPTQSKPAKRKAFGSRVKAVDLEDGLHTLDVKSATIDTNPNGNELVNVAFTIDENTVFLPAPLVTDGPDSGARYYMQNGAIVDSLIMACGAQGEYADDQLVDCVGKTVTIEVGTRLIRGTPTKVLVDAHPASDAYSA